MSGLDESALIVISNETKTVAKENFGMMLIVGPNVNSANRTVEVASLSEAALALAGGSSTPEYIKVRDAFSQQNSPATVKLGALIGTKTLTDNAGTFTAGSITGKVNGNAFTSGTYDTNKATTMAKLAAAIAAADTVNIQSAVYTDGSHIIVITPKTGKLVAITDLDLSGITGTMTFALTAAATETYTDGLAAIQLIDDEWYQLVIASSTKANVKIAAAFAEASDSPKFFATASSDADIVNVVPASDSASAGTIAAQLKGSTYTRSACFFSGTAGTDSVAATQAIEAAVFALIAAYLPGTYNVAYKEPAGITVDTLNAQQQRNSRGIYSNGVFVAGKDCNTFEALAGRNIIRWGRTCGGGWIDQVIFTDAIIADLQAAVYALFVNSLKVPRDINGYAMIEGAMETVFRTYQTAGAITPFEKDDAGNQIGGFRITMPALSAASDADKAGRVLNGVSWELWYASPINSIKMSGVIAL